MKVSSLHLSPPVVKLKKRVTVSTEPASLTTVWKTSPQVTDMVMLSAVIVAVFRAVC